MGFFFRKSIGLGPFRINLSKSGVGVSTGIKGARIWTGPRGTYVQVGREGFYYRQKIGSANAGAATTSSSTKPSETDWQNTLLQMPHGEVLESVKPPASNEQTLLIHALYLITTIATIISISYLAANNLDNPARVNLANWLLFTVPPTFWLIGIGLHYKAKLRNVPPLHPLYYRLDTERLARFSNIDKAFSALSKSHQIVSVKQGQVPAQVAIQSPPLIVTNVNVWALTISNWRMFFMPDRAYIFMNNAYSTVTYEDLSVFHKEWRLTAYQGHPSDATVVDRTWLHARKDGYPDRRYNYNPAIPIVLYGFVEIESKAGWKITLRLSNLQAAKDFFRYLSLAFPASARNSQSDGGTWYKQQQQSSYRSQKKSSPPPRSAPIHKSPYEVLGVREGASVDEVTAAYRKQAQMNHPDRVANMAAEFQELAERRMKEINAAYDELRKRWR
jgi:Protein of unknown function (DUF4236)/DnaJ domain